ncbi:MAG: hypothetical protein GWN46_15060 [Gammaproteobacteria bacterium]|nr:hypothetical protein [Gammaproteobacteria bacterium]
MSSQTLYTGVALIVLGIGGYVVSGAASVTALIPAFIGAVFVLLGLLGRKDSLRKHVMHVSILLALLAVGGTFRGITGVVAWLGGTPPERPMAVVVQAITALLCILLVVGGIRSFLAARKAG